MAKARKNPAAAALGRKGGQVRSGLSERIVKQRCRRLHAESLAVVRVPGSLLSLVTGDRHLAVRYVSSFGCLCNRRIRIVVHGDSQRRARRHPCQPFAHSDVVTRHLTVRPLETRAARSASVSLRDCRRGVGEPVA